MSTDVKRVCFILQVRPDRINEYVKRHEAVWPEMLEALQATGWRNYSLFLDNNGLLVGYLETDDFVAAQAAMADTEINALWQAEMAPFFVELEGRPDQTMRVLPLAFHLETQLEALRGTTDREKTS